MQTNRPNAGTLVAGTILIVFGILALTGRFFSIVDWTFIWPLIIIGLGSLFFIGMASGGRQSAAFAIPGSLISGIGLVMLFASVTGHWEVMSYMWTLIILFIGVGIYLMGWYGGDAGQKQAGRRVAKIGFILFVIFGAFFEMVFGSNALIFPLLLILLGLYLVFSRPGRPAHKQPEEPLDQSIPPAS